MYLADYHTHTVLSPDGSVPLAHMAAAAVAAGLDELCVTDHFDLMDLKGNWVTHWDWAPSVAQHREALPQFEGKLKLRLGVEFGSAPFDPAFARSVLDKAELDFVIGSLHNLSPERGGLDFFFTEYDTEEKCHAALDDYFSSMEALTKLPHCYDVLGHIIYPLRYMEHPVSLLPYYDRLRVILREAARTGRGMEVNTYRGKTLADWLPVLRMFREEGGEIVTIGSDAHTTDGVGKGCAAALELLRECGFRYQTVYEKRKPQFIKI